MSNEFKKFMTSYGPGWMSVTIISSALLVISLISMIIRNDLENFIPQLILFIVMVLTLLPLIRSNRFFKYLEEDAAFDDVSAEFEKAVPMRKNSVRFGENYIFIKRSAKLLKYSEITQLYQYIHKTNFIEDERALKYVDARGKHHRLCKLELGEKSKDELLTMVGMVLSKNPNIKIGYR